MKNVTITDLKKICQTNESAKHDGWYAQKITRKISIRLTKLLLHTNITGNQVTILWCFIDICGGLMFIVNLYWLNLLASLFLHIAFILDCTEGEIARYRNTCSLKGKYLDRLCHTVAYPLIFIGISIGVYNVYHDLIYLVMGYMVVVFFFGMWLANADLKLILRNRNSSSYGIVSILI